MISNKDMTAFKIGRLFYSGRIPKATRLNIFKILTDFEEHVRDSQEERVKYLTEKFQDLQTIKKLLK